jgi:hypothetical protein
MLAPETQQLDPPDRPTVAASAEKGLSDETQSETSRLEPEGLPESEVMEPRPHRVVTRGQARPARKGRQLFHIRFEVEEVLDAIDVHDAIRQAAARGITEITALNRVD